MLNKRSLEQSNKIIDWQAFWGDKWICFKKMNARDNWWKSKICGNFYIEYWLLRRKLFRTSCSQVFHRKTCSKNFLKVRVIRPKCDHWTLRKKTIHGVYWAFTKNPIIFPGFSKDTLKEQAFYYQLNQTKIRVFRATT